MEQFSGKPRVTVLPARYARGALNVAKWSRFRLAMRDKAQRVDADKRTIGRKPHEPGMPR
jgi:hypothetical protein